MRAEELVGFRRVDQEVANPDKCRQDEMHKPKLQNLQLYGQGTGINKQAVYLGVRHSQRLN